MEELNIPALFETWVHQQPNHIALVSESTTFTYGDLSRLSNRIAHVLLRAGIDQQTPTAILMEQGVLQIATSLGVLKAGGFYVALDPRNPIERSRLILKQSGCQLLVHDRDPSPLANTFDAPIRELKVDQLGAGLPDTAPALTIAADSLACLIYTSGSTGQPKGVMHTHASVLHNTERHRQEFAIQPGDRQSLVYSPAVYGGHRDTFNALLSGASLHLYPLAENGIAALYPWLQREQITLFCCVATIFRQFLRTLEPGANLPNLRLIKLGGERSFTKDIDTCRQRLSGPWRIHCGYGSSESGLVCSYFVDATTTLQSDAVPLGFAVDASETTLVDDDGRENNIGELRIRSRSVAKGYWRDESLTSRVFHADLDDPRYSTIHTGDLCRRDDDGCLWLIGRADFQVKINGNRVQLDEVEAAIKDIPEIQDVVVLARHDPMRGDSLEACLVSQQPMSVPDLRGRLATTLPNFMVPGTYRWLETLPQLPNGKVDRQALLQESAAPVATTAVPAKATATRTEREVIRLWCDVLGRSGIGLDDDFFESGGDSLRGMVLIAAVSREFGIQMPLVELLRSRRAREFAAAIDASGASRRFTTVVPFRTHGSRPPFFCVHGVFGGVMFLRELVDRLNAEQPVYGFQPPNLDGSRFRFRSLAELAAHYITEMKAVQPKGPYFIGGFSFGGTVVFEMASQLTKNGEDVRLLALFDCRPPNRQLQDVDADSDLDQAAIGPSLRTHLRSLRRGGRPTTIWLRRTIDQLLDAMRPRFQHFMLRFAKNLDVINREGYLSWNHRRLLRQHIGTRYDGDAVVFAGDGRSEQLVAAWSSWIGGQLRLVTVPGKHREIFWSPNVDHLARELERWLRD